MAKLFLILWTLVITSNGVLYIDRYTAVSTTMLTWTVNYTHDSTGNSITNVTMETLVTLKKVFVYITIKAAENEHDREYKYMLVKSVVDLEKAFKKSQSNLILKRFIGQVVQFMDFEVKFPMLPVSILRFPVIQIQKFLISNF